MAVGQDYQCINIKAAQYNREKKQRAEEERLAAAYRAEQARLASERRRRQQMNAARTPAKGAVRTNTVSRSAAVRHSAAAGHSAEAVRGTEYGFGSLLAEMIGTAAGWIYRKHRAGVKARAEQPEYKRIRTGNHRSIPIAFVGYLAVFAVIAGMLLVGNARVSSAKSGNNDLKARIAAAETLGKSLDEKLERGMDAAFVEAYAVGELGMVKKSEVSRKYITFGGEEKIVSAS